LAREIYVASPMTREKNHQDYPEFTFKHLKKRISLLSNFVFLHVSKCSIILARFNVSHFHFDSCPR